MRYIVTRTSSWSDIVDCEDAVYLENEDVSVVELKDLEELNRFVNKYGKVVIKRLRKKVAGCTHGIEIYDTYRE